MAQFIDPKVSLTPDKKITNRELARLIRQSIAAEEEATHLYEFVADLVDDEFIKEVFQEVANEEKVHKGEFQAVLEHIEPSEKEFIEEGYKEVNENREKLAEILYTLTKD